MRPFPSCRSVGVLLGSILVTAGGAAGAGDGPSAKALARHGLTRSGTVLVLEDETKVHAKADDVRNLARQWGAAVAKRRATLSEKEYQDTIKQLTSELNQLRSEVNVVSQNINRLPRGRRGYPANNIVAEEQAELNYYRSQLQMEISQRTTFLNQLKSQPFDPKARIKADTEVREREEALHQGLLDLRTLVDGVHEKYQALAKDEQVKKWLGTPEGPAGVKPRLGPSRAFQLDEKLLERLEAQSSGDEPGAAAQPKAARKRHRSTTKRPARASEAASPF
jgi:hypothetical protein